MSGEGTPTRARRKSRKSDVVPSASHYVGYVQDEETPEMIMKKFEAMEQVLAASKPTQPEGAPPADGAPANAEAQQLTEEQLQAVFKATSTFLPQHTLGDNFFREEQVSDVEIPDDDEEDPDEDDFFDDAREDGTTKKRTKKEKEKGEKKRQVGSHKLIATEVTDIDGLSYLVVRKKVRHQDPEEPIYTKIPPAPIPATWAPTVTPFVPPEIPAAAHSRIIEGDVLSYPLSSLGTFQGILLDPPLRPNGAPFVAGTITPAEFGKLHITPKVIPNGLIFVWVEKELIVEVVKQLKTWGFLYVENFVWVKKHVNNRIVTADSAFFRRSKLSLHIFRRAVQEMLELRHQRTAVRSSLSCIDVCFDFVRPLDATVVDKPECVYQMIETLLPTATDPATGKCNLLELGRTRAGWTSLVNVPKEKTISAPMAI